MLLAGAGLLFAFGLPGGFVLDDFANLFGLEQIGDSLLRAGMFLSDVPTGFPGRPLSYLTFIAQRDSWPRDPLAFKVVNIALHLLNGGLVYALVARLMSLIGHPRAAAIALAAAGIWLVHPIQVSTVLYVVQRMTELATLFCLLGFLAYLRGRSLACTGRTRRGYVWMSAAVLVFTPLAVLAKESGALLPLFIGVTEVTLLASAARPPRWKLWAAIFLALPPLALALYLGFSKGILSGYSIRSFGPADRLYTEAIILWDYVGKIVLPRPRTFGIYFDDYPIAASPFASLATAAAIAGWGAALAIAVAWRKPVPVVSFAIAWFLAGHVLESTVLPLELYFEHRNYLPLLGPGLALAWAADRLWHDASSPGVRRAYAMLGAAGAAALAGMTWMEARMWSDPIRQTVIWAREHPASERAQYELGSAYVFARRYAEANETFQRAQALAPGEAQFLLARVVLGCMDQSMQLPARDEVARSLAGSLVRPGVVNVIDTLVLRIEQGSCKRIDVEYALALVDGLLSNDRILTPFRRAGLHMKGRLHAVQGDLDRAVRSLEAADEIFPKMMSVQLQATWLLSADLHADALRAIQRGRADPRWRPWQRALYAGTFDAWERQVREAARSKGVALRNGA